MCEFARSVKDELATKMFGRSEDPNNRDVLRRLYEAADGKISGVDFQDVIAVNEAAEAFGEEVENIFGHKGKVGQAEEMVRGVAETMRLIVESKNRRPDPNRRLFARFLNLLRSLTRTRANQVGIYE